MYKIGEFSKLSKTTIKTLRFYDEIGLFKPSKVEENGYRMYSVEDLNTISTIRELRSFGVSIDDVKKVLSGGDLAGILIKRYDDIESEIEKKRSDLKTIGGIIAGLKKGESMKKYEAVEKTIPSFNVYYRHGVIASMTDILDFILGAGAEAKKNNPDIKCENYCYVTYEADEYQENNVELNTSRRSINPAKKAKTLNSKRYPKSPRFASSTKARMQISATLMRLRWGLRKRTVIPFAARFAKCIYTAVGTEPMKKIILSKFKFPSKSKV